jgi:hypothetical protein
VIAGDFSYALFVVLFLPSVVAEGLVYRRVKSRGGREAPHK